MERHTHRGRWWLASLVMIGLGAPAGAGADTSDPLWKCRASAAYATLGGQVHLEPVVANGVASADPAQRGRAQCVDDDAGSPTLGNANLSGRLPFAETRIDPDTGTAVLQTASARAGIDEVRLASSDGSFVVTANEVRSSAQGRCENGTPAFTGDSRVTSVTINDQEISLDAPLQQITTQLNGSPLGAVAHVALNQQFKNAQGIVVQAVRVVIVKDNEPAPVLDVVLAESQVLASGLVCNPAQTGQTGQTGLPPDEVVAKRVCPAGAEYDASSGFCVIARDRNGDGDTDDGSTGANGTGGSSNTETVIVGRPFEGPRGGTVVDLRDLPRAARNSPCAKGKGPRFAIVGDNGFDGITGTNRRDRIITLGGTDLVAGGRGNDCIDGGSGRDVLGGDEGNDKVFGKGGGDAMRGGFGKDRLRSGAGNDSILDSFGDVLIATGSGNDTLNAAQAGDFTRKIRCGRGRDVLRANRNERFRHAGCERVYIIR